MVFGFYPVSEIKKVRMSSKKDGADEMSRETYLNNSPIILTILHFLVVLFSTKMIKRYI